MRRTNAILGGLLAVSLTAAYLSWTSKADTHAEDGVVLVDARADDLVAVHYVSPEVDVRLTVHEDERGRWAWAQAIVEEKPEPTPHADAADEGGEAAEAASEPGERVTKEFATGEAGDRLLESLAPLRAKRALAAIADDKLAELGFGEEAATLTFELEDREPVVFEVGRNDFGGTTTYLRDPQSGTIWVLEGSVLAPLEQPDRRLANRTLVGAKTTEIVAATLADGDRALRLEHRNRSDPEMQTWAAEGAEQAHESAQAWMQKFLRLRASEYAAESDVPPLQVRFTVAIEDADGRTTTVEMLQGTDPDGANLWFARSEHTRGLVALPPGLAEETAADLGTVFTF
jgi:hypothetical protein